MANEQPEELRPLEKEYFSIEYRENQLRIASAKGDENH